MPFIGNQPTAVPLSGADLTDGIITPAKLSTTLDLSSKTLTLPAGVGGKVLQVVHSVNITADATSSASYVASSLVASITPSSTSSKILIILHVATNTQSSASGAYCHGAIYRDINGGGYSDIYSPIMLGGIKQTTLYVASSSGAEYIDSPNTTSQCNYKLYFKLTSGTDCLLSNDSTKKSFTLMEIAV